MAAIDVKSDVAGSVWKLVAKVGDQVAAEDTILIMEAMKMEIPVVAPAGGRIVEILFDEGEMVAEDEVVARIDA